MVTKRRVRQWLNVGMLIASGVVVILTAAHEKSSLGEKFVVIGTIIGALRATLPWVQSGLAKAVEDSKLPEE